MNNLTALETLLLRNIAQNLYQPGNGAEPAAFSDLDCVWSSCLNEIKSGEKIPDKSLPGVTASLVKKGLATVSGRGADSTVRLTETGFATYLATKGT
jgi:hypothetical protein